MFDEKRKQPIPELPRHVGIITSETGAVIHDILNVLGRRFPAIEVSVLPVQVQGNDSPRQIARSLAFANDYEANPFDVLLLARGGGSLEDLWSFNSEIVARAIADSSIPVVCAVGHESDVSIADFVADLRAPTPSAAAELISPDVEEWLDLLDGIRRRLHVRFIAFAENRRSHVEHLSKRLRHPGARLQELHQRLDNLEIRLHSNLQHQFSQYTFTATEQNLAALMHRQLERTRAHLDLTSKSLGNPLARIQNATHRANNLQDRLTGNIDQSLAHGNNRLQALAQNMNTLSPLATLERGYAIASPATDPAKVITDTNEVATGDLLSIRLQRGSLTAEVKETHDP